MKPIKNIADVEEEIKKALIIIKHMPTDGPKKVRSHWPMCLSEEVEELVSSRPIKYTKILPEEIDDMDEVLGDWMKCLDYNERNLVIMRCSGYSWKVLTAKLNFARSTLHSKYVFYLKKILRHVLNKQNENKKEEK